MSLLNRRVTNCINWCLDNLLPAFLRDNLMLMGPLMRLCLGPDWRMFVQFKEQAPSLSSREIEEIYDRLSSSHLQRATDLHPDSIRLIKDRVCGNRILDVGCGRGYLARSLHQELNVEVVGFDIKPPTEDTSKAGPSFYSGQADNLPFKDNSFDTVICTHMLEHTTEPQAVIHELRRVAKNRLIIIVPRQRPYRYTFDLHLHFFPYPHSLDLLMGAPEKRTRVVGGDLYYEESLH